MEEGCDFVIFVGRIAYGVVLTVGTVCALSLVVLIAIDIFVGQPKGPVLVTNEQHEMRCARCTGRIARFESREDGLPQGICADCKEQSDVRRAAGYTRLSYKVVCEAEDCDFETSTENSLMFLKQALKEGGARYEISGDSVTVTCPEGHEGTFDKP